MFSLYEGLGAAWDARAPAAAAALGGALPAALGGAPPAEALAQARALLCGCAAGAGAKLLVYPLDTAKRRLQVQGFARAPALGPPPPRYAGAAHALASMAAGPEGARGWFKGLAPALAKAGASAALGFWAYEGAARALRGAGPPWADEGAE